MAFARSRPDPARLARLAFAEAWLALADPSEAGHCDPMDVRDRLAMYRLLVERVNRHGAFGAGDALSPLWGYASQLAWQHASGRLGGAGTAIAPASWWGACNYALSVVPYVAAAELALVPALAMPAPPAAYGPAREAWRAAWIAAWALRPGDDHDPVRGAIWRAHLASIRTAVARHAREFLALPAGERRFARGWVRMVDLFGAAAVRTDLERLTGPGAAVLPARMLGEDVTPEAWPRGQRGVVRRVVALGDRPAWRWAIEVSIWQRMMRTRAARADAELLLAGALGRGRGAWPLRLRALAYAALPGPVAGLVPARAAGAS